MSSISICAPVLKGSASMDIYIISCCARLPMLRSSEAQSGVDLGRTLHVVIFILPLTFACFQGLDSFFNGYIPCYASWGCNYRCTGFLHKRVNIIKVDIDGTQKMSRVLHAPHRLVGSYRRTKLKTTGLYLYQYTCSPMS